MITGSARGIGKTIAAAFGRSGAKVAICDLNRAASKATVREMRATGIDAYFFSVDLSKRGGPQRLVAAVAKKLGRIDILVNNARAERCHPLRNVGFASDVADTTQFLCSDSARFITGQAIVVDGGLTIQDPWALMSAAATTAVRA